MTVQQERDGRRRDSAITTVALWTPSPSGNSASSTIGDVQVR
jgi:hypothetical protein